MECQNVGCSLAAILSGDLSRFCPVERVEDGKVYEINVPETHVPTPKVVDKVYVQGAKMMRSDRSLEAWSDIICPTSAKAVR